MTTLFIFRYLRLQFTRYFLGTFKIKHKLWATSIPSKINLYVKPIIGRKAVHLKVHFKDGRIDRVTDSSGLLTLKVVKVKYQNKTAGWISDLVVRIEG